MTSDFSQFLNGVVEFSKQNARIKKERGELLQAAKEVIKTIDSTHFFHNIDVLQEIVETIEEGGEL